METRLIVEAPFETKICPFCAETIKAAAEVCPRCRSRLKRKALKLSDWLPAAAMFGLVMGPLLLASWWIRDLQKPGRDFAAYRDQLVITKTSFRLSRAGNTNYFTALGYIHNNSPYPWNELQLEVQCFDRSNSLVDTRTEILRYQELPAGLTEAFRVRFPLAAEETNYASHQIFIRSAHDANSVLR